MDRKATLMQGDCLELMKSLPDASIDMVLCDLPYGTTSCTWDSVIPFAHLWKQYRRIIKTGAPVILFGAEPFSSMLRLSAIDWFKYDWVWEKQKGSNVMQAKNAPLKVHEMIHVFSEYAIAPTAKRRMNYKPQGLREAKRSVVQTVPADGVFGGRDVKPYTPKFTGYPRSVIGFNTPELRLHPTQKPVALMEYLIRTYSNKGDAVLDNCMGSGTTGVACVNTGRSFIGMEMDPGYFLAAQQRIAQALENSKQ